MPAKSSISAGFRWVLGNGMKINAVKDPWLRGKEDFRVDREHNYEAADIMVSNFSMMDSKN